VTDGDLIDGSSSMNGRNRKRRMNWLKQLSRMKLYRKQNT
jgi:hypothetical protein